MMKMIDYIYINTKIYKNETLVVKEKCKEENDKNIQNMT